MSAVNSSLQAAPSERSPASTQISLKSTALNHKVSKATGDSFPCYPQLNSCLQTKLQGKVSKDVIKDVANHLQNAKIPVGQEHYTVQKELFSWNRNGAVDYGVLNNLHLALIACRSSVQQSSEPSYKQAVPNHSDK